MSQELYDLYCTDQEVSIDRQYLSKEDVIAYNKILRKNGESYRWVISIPSTDDIDFYMGEWGKA